MTEPVLRAEQVTVAYGADVAVRAADLVVRPGELVAVTGASGAGKTSLLNALGGVRAPTSGTVSFAGRPYTDRVTAAGHGVVLIPQGNGLVRLLTAIENVAIPLVARGRRHARASADAALDAVGLGEAAQQLVEELSGGQQQRLAIARGLAECGAVILADEPTSELDAQNRNLVLGLLRAECARGAAVVMATHDPEAAAFCDAELRLDEGVVTFPRDDRSSRDDRSTRDDPVAQADGAGPSPDGALPTDVTAPSDPARRSGNRPGRHR